MAMRRLPPTSTASCCARIEHWGGCAALSVTPHRRLPESAIFAAKSNATGTAASIELGGLLRYTGTRLRPREQGLPGPFTRLLQAVPDYPQYIKGLMMSSTFDQIANIIAETCDIPRDTIKPESHAIDDLGIDSLDFLDIAFAIDKAFGIKMPLEKWTQEVNDGKATTEQYFVLQNLADRIDELVAAKNAAPGA
jgi:acyl carrier protein